MGEETEEDGKKISEEDFRRISELLGFELPESCDIDIVDLSTPRKDVTGGRRRIEIRSRAVQHTWTKGAPE